VAPKGAELVCRAAGRAPIPCAAAASGEHWKVAPEREREWGRKMDAAECKKEKE